MGVIIDVVESRHFRAVVDYARKWLDKLAILVVAVVPELVFAGLFFRATCVLSAVVHS